MNQKRRLENVGRAKRAGEPTRQSRSVDGTATQPRLQGRLERERDVENGGAIVRLTDEEDAINRLRTIQERRTSEQSMTSGSDQTNVKQAGRALSEEDPYEIVDLREPQEATNRPNLSSFISREAYDELDPPPASMRRLSYLNRSAAVYKIPLNESSYLMVSSNETSPVSSCQHHQTQQPVVVAAKQPIIVVEPHTDDSLRCNCRNCQFLSGWCCMPTVLMIVIVVVIIWFCMRPSNNPQPIDSKMGNGTGNHTARSSVQAELLNESDESASSIFGII